MTMITLDQLVAAITVDTDDNDAAEQAFAARLRDLLDTPTDAECMGREVVVKAIESTPERARPRALVTDGDHDWHICFDALRFPQDSPLASVVDAYRYWLGYQVDAHHSRAAAAHEAVPSQRLDARIAELETQIDDALTILESLDLDELEIWLGDDDPWGRNEQYWPDSMARYQEQAHQLGDLADDTARLIDAGRPEQARRLLETILFGLEGVIFDYFCPDDVATAASDALESWLRSIGELTPHELDASQAARKCTRWIKSFDLYWEFARLLEHLPAIMEAPLVDELERHILDVERRRSSHDDRLLNILTALRKQRGEIELLWERLTTDVLDEDAIDTLALWWMNNSEFERALHIVDEWIQHNGSRTPLRIDQRRRQLLAHLGRTDEALDELWRRFESYPSARVFAELLDLAPQDEHDQLRARAINVAADNANALVDLASELPPCELLAAALEATPFDELCRVSSWTLQDAAPNLESQWPRAAVQLYTALGMRHVDRGKPKYYGLSIDAFEKAFELYRALDQLDQWENVAAQITAEHGRKYTFMPGFRAIGHRD